ncbi:glycosyltransferase family 4 protein [Winogradskyella sp. HB-48]|uniref:glycosyltransferase family 4 protein n=1 Tax=Winogradskyella sp. HB-48 TaxID=3416808 RepID=UPI003CED5754
MRITWVTRSFLDYRIPIYEELNRLCDNNLTLIYNAEVVPERCKKKVESILGTRAIGLEGELRLSGKKIQPLSDIKKGGIRIPVQPNLINTIKKSQADVLISDGFFQWTYAALWLKLIAKIPHIMCYEGTEHTEKNAGFLRLKYRKLASKCIDMIHVNGILSKQFLSNVLHIPEHKIALMNMTTEIDVLEKKVRDVKEDLKLKLKKELNLKTHVFLYVGRLVQLKGVSHLLQTWEVVNFEEASLLIIGDGSEREALEAFVTSKALKNVHFTGAIDYDDIYKFFAISNCFIIPTLKDNWSLVVPEAMSCGLPIMSSKYNGCWPELVTPKNGWVFDPLDTDQFVETLQQAYANKEQWKAMGKESQHIIQAFSPEKVASRIFNSCKTVAKHG